MTTRAGAARRSPLRRWGLPALRVAVIVAVGALAVWKLDLGEVHDAFKITSWALLAVAVAANFASVAFKGLAWKGVVDALPGRRQRTRYVDVIPPLFIGFLFNTVLAARVGELVKAMLLRRRMARRGPRPPTTTLLGTVVAENLVSTITWVGLVVGIGLFMPLPSYAWFASVGLGAACLAIVLVATLSGPGRQLPPWLDTGPLWARARRAMERFWVGVRESHLGLREPRQLATVVGASLLSWLAQWAGIYFTLMAFGLDEVGWGGAGLLLVTITLAQAFPVLPGNLLVFQAAAVVPLTASYGVHAAEALAFSVVLQATEAVVGVAVGFLFLVAEGVGFGQLRREAEAEDRREQRAEAARADPLARS
ncbi:lysylphosphatidylglycerol synthase transmembrane domain-containing protein [Miltoncostaea marina]|uniref:lysylphosphatidylglycerol synthase transmembrane domain-containing protein n=1 Tax=Miltoncostaea marina TaxID=2843215 RepID=UPI001C3D7A09|nr:lysylphosphatidylglycerol synthase transmembrane domain-containing protein [Miltoncostaea marina]